MAFNLSPGVLYGAIDLLTLLRRSPLPGHDISRVVSQFSKVPSETVLRFVLDAGLATTDAEGNLRATVSSEKLAASDSTTHQLRVALAEYITNANPPWAELIPRGRREVRRGLSRDLRQCLAEADLMQSPPAEEIVQWWDDLARLFRGLQHADQIATGRQGERLSAEWEYRRTGHQPTWIAIDSNSAGYDLLSVVSPDDLSPLLVEVKATTAEQSYGSFYLTRHEWETATQSRNYILHLWSLSPVPRLIQIDVNELAEHIPVDRGAGIWDVTKISVRNIR